MLSFQKVVLLVGILGMLLMLVHFKNVHVKKLKMQNVLCCLYRQHFHDCYTALNSSGCILGTAISGGVPPTIICSSTNNCVLPMDMSGFFLSGFQWNCDYCA